MQSSVLAALSLATAFCLTPAARADADGFNCDNLAWQGHAHFHVRPDASTSPVGYVPAQIKHAYGFDLLTHVVSGATVAYGGSGQKIAVVEAYGSPTAQADLNTFSTKFGLPATTLQIVYGTVKPTTVNGSWALETSLDVQWAHALAPNATIILSVAASAGLSDFLAAVDAAVKAGATVVSMSWGSSEFTTETSYESHFQKAGVTFLASSGDNGAGTQWPAISPSVIGVGATTLHLSSTGTLTSPEVGWTGSGGGFSLLFTRPAYQNGWQTNAYRACPDVSIVGDPNTGVAVYDGTAYNGATGWFQVGGTSASAPMWGAVVALTNEQQLLAKAAALTGGNAALYTLAGSTKTTTTTNSSGVSTTTTTALYSTYFFDVTSGSNGAYSATAKFDEVTGLGTPIVPTVAVKW